SAAMRPSRMMSVWFSRGWAPVPSITRTCVSATVGVSTATYWRTLRESAGRCAGRPTAARMSGRASAAEARASDGAVRHGAEVGEYRMAIRYYNDGARARPRLLLGPGPATASFFELIRVGSVFGATRCPLVLEQMLEANEWDIHVIDTSNDTARIRV